MVAGLGSSAGQMGKCRFNWEATGAMRVEMNAIGPSIGIGTIGL